MNVGRLLQIALLSPGDRDGGDGYLVLQSPELSTSARGRGYFASRRSRARALLLAEHELIVGQIVLEELRRVLEQKIGLPESAVEEAVSLLEEHRVVPTVDTDPGVEVPDPSDARVLATALEAGAEMLVTGDRDLLSVKDHVRGLRILDPRGFWEELR